METVINIDIKKCVEGEQKWGEEESHTNDAMRWGDTKNSNSTH